MKKVWLTNLPYAFCMGVIIYVLLILHKPNNLIEILIYYAISICVFFIPFYFRGLDEEERNDLKGIISIIMYREEKDQI